MKLDQLNQYPISPIHKILKATGLKTPEQLQSQEFTGEFLEKIGLNPAQLLHSKLITKTKTGHYTITPT